MFVGTNFPTKQEGQYQVKMIFYLVDVVRKKHDFSLYKKLVKFEYRFLFIKYIQIV